MQNVAGDASHVFCSSGYLYDDRIRDGQFVPIICDLSSGKWNYIDVDKEHDSYPPFYLEKDSCIAFYSDKLKEAILFPIKDYVK